MVFNCLLNSVTVTDWLQMQPLIYQIQTSALYEKSFYTSCRRGSCQVVMQTLTTGSALYRLSDSLYCIFTRATSRICDILCTLMEGCAYFTKRLKSLLFKCLTFVDIAESVVSVVVHGSFSFHSEIGNKTLGVVISYEFELSPHVWLNFVAAP